MRYGTRLTGVALCFLTFILPSGAADNNAAPYDSEATQISLAQYKQELARIDAQLKVLVEHPEAAGSLHSSIPEEWELQTQSGSFEIDNGDLLNKLEQFSRDATRRGEVL